MSILSSNFHGGRKERHYVEDRDPFDEFHHRDAITTIRGPTKSSVVNAHIDWKETSDAHVFKIELPGVRKNEVKVEVEGDGVLCISGEKVVEKEEDTEMWHRVERVSGKFSQRIGLPHDANVERVKADMSNGVLTITVPKHHFKKHSARFVEVTGR